MRATGWGNASNQLGSRGVKCVPINQTLSALVFFNHDVKAMTQFPVEYAGYAAHYAQRALRRWEALNSIQTRGLDRGISYQQALTPLMEAH